MADETTTLVELLEKKYAALLKPYTERVRELGTFKEVVSKRLLDLNKYINDFKQLFKNFAAEQQVKLQHLKVFSKDVDYYCDLLTLNIKEGEIVKSLEKDITITEGEAKKINYSKEFQIKKLLDVFDLN